MNRRLTVPCPVISRLPLAVVAVGLCAVGCSREADILGGGSDQDHDVIRMSGDPPAFVFPDDVKTDDPSVNAFIEEFGRICIEGEYDKYRMKVCRRSDPVSKEDFEQVWHNISEIHIWKMFALPEPKGMPTRRYAVFAKVKVEQSREEPEKLVVLQVLRELGKWVIDVLPSEELDLLFAVASQPTTAPTTTQATSRTQ